MEDKDTFDELLEHASNIAVQLLKFKTAFKIASNNPDDCARAIRYIKINRKNPKMFNYKHYTMTVKNPLPQDEFECLKEVYHWTSI